MNLVDIGLIFITLLFGILGFKRGTFKTLIYLVAIIVVTVVSYEFKDFIGELLMKFLPFIKFKGEFAGITSLNVLFYKGLAFLIVFAILMLVIGILVKISGFLDLLVKATLILEIPSKIIGLVLGLIEGVIISFVISFALVQIPIPDNPVYESKLAPIVLKKTPILSGIFKDSYNLNESLYKLIDEKLETLDSEEVNEEVLNALEKHGDITKEDIKDIKEKGKEVLDKLVDKVKGEEND